MNSSLPVLPFWVFGRGREQPNNIMKSITEQTPEEQGATLKVATDEIKAVLKKHDIAGYAVLQSPDRAEWLMGIDPSWSVAKWEEMEEGLGIRLKSSLMKDYEGDKQKQKQELEWTCGIFLGLLSMLEQHHEAVTKLMHVIGSKFDIRSIVTDVEGEDENEG